MSFWGKHHTRMLRSYNNIAILKGESEWDGDNLLDPPMNNDRNCVEIKAKIEASSNISTIYF